MVERHIGDGLLNDPNYRAYIEANSQGDFNDLAPGTYVAFINGLFIGSAANWEELERLDEIKNREAPVFVHQVHMPEVVYDVPSPLSIDDSEDNDL